MLCLPSYATPVVWARMDSPPTYIVSGENAGKGVYELMINFFDQQMPQYEMRFVDMSLKRYWHELAKGHNYCKADSLKNNNRIQQAHFSTPVVLIPPVSIAIHFEDWRAIGQPQSYPLTALLNHNNLLGAIVNKRSYGPRIDAIFQLHEADSNLHRKVVKPTQLYSMLALRRINYTLAHAPLVKMFLAKKYWPNVKIIAIDEEEDYYTIHVSCTKNLWGQKFIADLNPIIKKHRTSKYYLQFFKAYGPDTSGFYLRYRDEFSRME